MKCHLEIPILTPTMDRHAAFLLLDWTVIRDVSFAWIATWLLGCNLGNLRLQPVKNRLQPLTFPQPPSPDFIYFG